MGFNFKKKNPEKINYELHETAELIFFFFRIGEWVYFVRVFYCVMKVTNAVNGD